MSANKVMIIAIQCTAGPSRPSALHNQRVENSCKDLESYTTTTCQECAADTMKILGERTAQLHNTTERKMAYGKPGRIGRGQHDLSETICENAYSLYGAHSG